MKHALIPMVASLGLLLSAGLVQSPNPIGAYADNSNGVNYQDVSFGTTFNYGSVGGWTGETLEQTDNGVQEYRLFRDVVSYGNGLFGDQILSELEEGSFAEEQAAQIHMDKINANIYSDGSIKDTIGIGYDMALLAGLKSIASASGYSFNIPALVLGNEAVALFHVSASKVELATYSKSISSVRQSYTYWANYDSLGNTLGYTYATDISFTFQKGKISKVSELYALGFGSFSTSQPDDYIYDYTLGYQTNAFRMFVPSNQSSKVVSLPFDVTYFDFEHGHLGLGHSAYGTRYGTTLQPYYLKDLSVTIRTEGEDRSFTFSSMTQSEYDYFAENGVTSDTRSGAFALLSRGKRSDEIGGEGSMVRAYHWPKKPYSLDKTARITINSLGFYANTGAGCGLSYAKENATVYRFGVPYGAIQFMYIADKATAKCTYEWRGVDYASEHVNHVAYPTWTHWVVGILCPGLGTAAIYGMEELGSTLLSKDMSFQRLHFNLTDADNHLITNVFKLDFKYQEGGKESNNVTVGGITTAQPVDGKEWKYKEVHIDEGSKKTIEMSMFTAEFASDGFVSVEDDPIYIQDKDGNTTRSYSYYYQDVYETKTYSDRMCYWEPLSIYHTVDGGETQRLYSTKDGTFLVRDEDGNVVVANEDGIIKDITPEEWLNGVETEGTNHGQDNGNRNNHDQWADSVQDWWNNITNIDDSWKTAIGIALAVAGGIIIIFLVFKFFGFFSGSSRGGSGRRRR